MLRLCCNSSRAMVRNNTPRLLQGQRSQLNLRYSSSGGRVLPKILGTSLVMSATTLGGVVGYSAVDQEFRRMVEESIPGTSELLELMLGKEEEIISPPKPAPSKLKISSPVMITSPKLEEEESSLNVPQEAPTAAAHSVITSESSAPVEDVTTSAPVEGVATSAPTDIEEASTSTLENQAPVETVPLAPVEAVSATPGVPFLVEIQEPESFKELITSADVHDTSDTSPRSNEEATEDDRKGIREDEDAVSNKETLNDEKVHLPLSDEAVLDVENTSLEEMLSELCKEMQDMVSTAVSGYEASSEAVMTHINIMQKVLESNLTAKDESVWNEMFVAAQIKSEKDRQADTKEKDAMVAITNVLESISAGRRNKVTSTNPKLVEAEEEANKAIYKLDQAKSMRAAKESEASVMEEYKDLVEAGREQFHKEMASIMPDVKLGEKKGKLTEDELNMFITHAYRKVLFLQQEVAKQQTLEAERFKKALDKQRMETEDLALKHVQGELDRQAREFEVEHEKKMAAIKEDGEAELRAQLKRQAAAHTDHLSDVLSVQEAELIRHHEHQMAEQVNTLDSMQMATMSNLSGKVHGLAASVEARAASDSASLASQALWLACNSLNTTINRGEVTAQTWEQKLKPLVKEVEQVKTVADGDEFVDIVLATISPVALERGVYTEDSLKERFIKVEKIARRVAGVGEEGGTLLSYGFSYLQSLLMVNLEVRNPPGSMMEVDMSKMSTMDLVTMAKLSLEQGDLVRAVKVMTQVKGEAGMVASDWVSEARLTLETMQAVQLMMLHSLATSCKHLPGL